MCIGGASQRIMNDDNVQRMLSNPILDLVHKQVVMVLYSLRENDELGRYEELLPTYLAADWTACSDILDTIERAGLIKRNEAGIELTYDIPFVGEIDSCGCHK